MINDRAIGQGVNFLPFIAETRVRAKINPVRFVLEDVALGQDLL
jgi:hypothetical protein